MDATGRPASPPTYVGLRLAGMMFLQYFSLGAWIVPFGRFLAVEPENGGLGLSPAEVGLFHTPLPIAGMFAPFAIGLLADRLFPAQKLLSVLQIGMAVFLGAAAYSCGNEPGYIRGPLFGAMFGYALLLMPSLTLTNVIALRNLENPAQSFGSIRLVGTFGWVVSGGAVSLFLNPVSPAPLVMAASVSAVLGLFSIFLPHTPPKSHDRRFVGLGGLPSAKFLGHRAFLAFAVASVLGNMMNQFYTLFALRHVAELGIPRPVAMLTIGQWVEMASMAASPWLVRRYGLKTVMLAGLASWVIRNVVMAAGSPGWIVAVALPMHGTSYVFFTVVGTLFVDRESPPHLRAATQAMVTFLTSGPAVLAGYALAGATAERWEGNWSAVWAVPTVGCAVGGVFFAIFFRDPKPHPLPQVA